MEGQRVRHREQNQAQQQKQPLEQLQRLRRDFDLHPRGQNVEEEYQNHDKGQTPENGNHPTQFDQLIDPALADYHPGEARRPYLHTRHELYPPTASGQAIKKKKE